MAKEKSTNFIFSNISALAGMLVGHWFGSSFSQVVEPYSVLSRIFNLGANGERELCETSLACRGKGKRKPEARCAVLSGVED